MFIETRYGWFNLSKVREIIRNPEDKFLAYLHHGNDESEQAYISDVKNGLYGMQPLIPAQPNTFLLQYSMDSEDGKVTDFVTKEPVLAWRADGDVLLPVCCQSIAGNDYAIMFPNGQVILPEDCMFDDYDQWKEHCEQKAKHDRERAAKNAAATGQG